MQTAKMPDGNVYDVTGLTQEQIDNVRRNLLKQMGAFPEPEQGFFSRAGDLLELGGRELLSSGAEGLATLTDLADDERTDSIEQSLQSFAESQRQASSDIEGIKPLQEAEGVGDVLSSAASYLTQSVPEMGTIFAGAGVGAKVGTAFGPLGSLIGGLSGATLAGIVPFLGRNTEEFKQAQGRNPDRQEALSLLGTATVQSGLNALITRLVPFKGSPKITTNMIQKGLAGTGLEGSTELAQDALQILSANNFNTDALLTDESVFRLTESALAGGTVGGTLGVATAPFTTEPTPPPVDPALAKAAQDFVAGRPRALESPDTPLQLTAQEGVQTPETTPSEVTTRAGERRQEVLTGRQEPFLQSRPDAKSDSPELDALRTTSLDAMRQAQESGLDPLSVFSDPEVARQLDDAVARASTVPVNIGPSAASRAEQETSQLTGEQVLEFARNRKSDPIIAGTLKAGIPVKRKIELLQRRFAELNVSPTTASEAGETGAPILRKTAEPSLDPEGFADRGVAEGEVEAPDVASQPRMEFDREIGPTPLDDDGVKRTTDREAVEPDDNEGLLRTLNALGQEESTRTAQDGTVDTAATDINFKRYQGATNYLNARLKELTNRGQQGKKVADSIRNQVLQEQTMGANEIVGAFMAADAIVDTLGGKGIEGGVDVNFLKTLENKKGQSLNGLKNYKPTYDGKLQAVIDLAFYNDNPTRVAQTAQHEAFHVLQDFYTEYSPSDAKILSSVYKLRDGKVNYKALPSTIRKLWKRYAPEEHKKALNGTLPKIDSPSEFQAMTYEFYQRAKQAGDQNPLSGPFGKYFDFISRFLPRLTNSLKGMGFQTVEDVFTRAAKGATAQQIQGRQVSPRQNNSPIEESTRKESEVSQAFETYKPEESIRNIFAKYQDALPQTRIQDRGNGEFFVSEHEVNYVTTQKRPVILTPFSAQSDLAKGVVDYYESTPVSARQKFIEKYFSPEFFTLVRQDSSTDAVREITDENETLSFYDEIDTIQEFHVVKPHQKLFERLRTADEKYPYLYAVKDKDGDFSFYEKEYTLSQLDAGFPREGLITTSLREFLPLPETRIRRERDLTVIATLKPFDRNNLMVDLGEADRGKGDKKSGNKELSLLEKRLEDGETVRLLNLDFKVDNTYGIGKISTEIIPSEVLSEMFGKVVASARKILDDLNEMGKEFDGLVFSGNTSAKQRIYNFLARSAEFKKAFPELADPISTNITSIILNKPTDTQLELFSEESIRLDRVQDLTDFPLAQQNDRIADSFDFDDGMRRRSSLDILYNDNFDPLLPDADRGKQRDGVKRIKGRNVSEVGRMLHERALKFIDEPLTYLNRTPESDEKLSRILAAETEAARLNNPDTNATNWYTENIRKAIESVSQLYPEVATDREHRSAFSLALAITSQGIKVNRNARLGLGAYEFWRENGRFPVYGEAKAGPAMRKNFINANVILDAFQKKNESFFMFLDTEFTVKELTDALNSMGITTGKGGVNLSGEQMTANVYGSFMFGPKIGQGFYQNLMGNFTPVTIDLWMMRTWGRLTGTLSGNQNAYRQNIDDMKIEMRNENVEFDEELFGVDEQYTFDKVAEQNSIGEAFYKSQKDLGVPNNQIKKTNLMKVASRAVDNGAQTVETPSGGQQRQYMRDIINRARQILSERGVDLTVADMQAILWYPEKDVYAKLTKGKLEQRLNENYEDAFKEIVNEKARLRTVDGTARKDAVRDAIQKADAKSSPKAGRTVSEEEESIRFTEQDYRTTDGMRQVMADPRSGSVTSAISGFLGKFTSKDKLTREGTRLVNEFIHGLAPISRRELELNYRRTGEKRYLPFAEGAFKILEVAQQLSGRMEMFSKYGAPKLEDDGTVSIVEGTQGLQEIFKPIGTGDKYAKFQMYVYAQRAQRLKREGRENLMNDEQIAEGMRYGAENPEFDAVFKQYKNFNESLMRFMVDTGSLDQETANKLIGTADYVPFYRIIDEEQYTEGFFGQVKRATETSQNSTSAFDNPDRMIKSVIQKLRGGEEKIGDLYENIFANTQAMVSAGLRNQATQRVIKVVEELKKTGFYDGEGITKPKEISATEAKGNNNHFSYRENGKTKFFDVGSDGELITAMRTFTPLQMTGILRTMQQMGRFFRNMITITPGFMTANLIRGDMAGVVTVDAPLRPMVDTMIGLKNALTDAETVQEMKTIGGFGGYTFGESNTEFAKKMKRFYRRHEGYEILDTPQKLTDAIGNMIEKVNRVGEATEMATREGIYRRMTEAGSEKGDAAYEALNLINYSRKGNPQGGTAQTLAMLLPLVPFLNARIQGLYRTGTAVKGESNPKRTIMKGMTLMGLSMALYAMSSQEDEWDDEPLHRKLNYYIIYAGDRKFLIPKPFEIGAIFSTIPELFVDGVRKKDGEYVSDGLMQIFLNNFSFNPIPQAVSPILEVATNRDFFRGRELESLGVRGLPTEMRSYSTTSEFAKLMGGATSILGVSPIEFEQLVNGYLGSMGSLVLGGTDAMLSATGAIPKRPSGIFGSGITDVTAQTLGITRFVKDRENDPSSRYISEFYEMKREADEIVRGINRLREEGNYEDARDMQTTNRALIAVRKQLNKKYRQLNEINDRIQGIRASGITPDLKKSRIDLLIRQRKRVVSNMETLKQRIRGN